MKTELVRQQMVEQQVRAWDVLDGTVLNTLKDLPREQFVPARFVSMAFADIEIPLGHGQSMMTPTVEGRVLQSLALKKTDRVLEIGTGSGFLTACFARMAASVVSVDIYDDLLQSAGAALREIGAANSELLQMDATQQLPDGSFDAIAVTGSIPRFDARLLRCLNPGGRLFVVVGDSPVMEAQLITSTADEGERVESLFETELMPLLNCELKPQFFF